MSTATKSKKKPAKADTIHVTINPASKGQITGTVKAAPATAPVDRAAALSSAARKAWETRRANGWVHPSAKSATAPAPVSAPATAAKKPAKPSGKATTGSKPAKTTKATSAAAKGKAKASKGKGKAKGKSSRKSVA